jgi:methylthioribose-1-phosphate isomerase
MSDSTPATGHRLPTLSEQDGRVTILDQTRLPREATMLVLATLEEAAHAIRVMQVRGAPLIGATAAYGVALMERVLRKSAPATRRELAWREARAIAAEDMAANAAIGRHGMPLLQARQKGAEPIQVMTHCNAGRLATVEHGTAISPIYAAHAAGLPVHVWVSETRPRNQGLLTAWELAEAGVPHTLIADNAAGLLLMQGKVDLVIVGADRIAANGDTANKVGTYLKALAAHAHGVPFYVAAPLSTIDFACPTGRKIPIEERAAEELGAAGIPVANPAFDVTPAALISGIISERGVAAADSLGQWR